MASFEAAARRIAVLGSNSFSGADFIDHVLEDGSTAVLGVSRSPEKTRTVLPYLEKVSANFRFVQADLNDDQTELLEQLDRFRPQYIVNFSAQGEVATSWLHPEHWFQTNVVALSRLVNSLKHRSYLQRFVQISSPEVYGSCEGRVDEHAPLNPSTPYAASKASADLLLGAYQKNFAFPVVWVRATNVYGPHQQFYRIIPRSIIRLRMGEMIELHGGGKAVKSFIHIRDVSRGEEAIMENGKNGEIYHLSPDQGIEVRAVVRKICEQMGKDFSQCALAVADRIGQDAAYIIDSGKARSQLGWYPRVNFNDGLAEVIAWVDRFWADIAQANLDYVHTA